MVRLPGPSTFQGHGRLYPPGQSQFEMMPNEILTMIVGELSQTRLQSYLDLQNKKRVRASRTADQNTRSLCLTSKRVDSIARLLLFRTITVSSLEKLLLLYLVLRETEHLGHHIRQISLEVVLKRVKPNEFCLLHLRATNLLDTTMWEKPARPLNIENQAYRRDQILSAAYFEVLRRTPGLQQLVLRIPEVSFRLGEEHERDITFAYEPFFKKVRDARASTSFLPHLKDVRLLGNPDNPTKMVMYEICAPLFRNCTLETINLSQVMCPFDDPDVEVSGRRTCTPESSFETVKAVELQDCLCVDREFRELGGLFPNLESLKLALMMDDLYNSYGPKGMRGQNRFEDLQGALTKMKSLRNLGLGVSHTCKAIEMSKMPADGLSLSALPRLEILRIPLLVLVRGDSTAAEVVESRLRRALPRSLKHLTVTVEVSCLGHWHGDNTTRVPGPTSTPTSTVLDFLERLLVLGRELCPGLEDVVCCYSMKGYRRRQEIEVAETRSTDLEEADLLGLDEDSSERLEQLRRSVQLQSIRFGVAYEEVFGHIEGRQGGWA